MHNAEAFVYHYPWSVVRPDIRFEFKAHYEYESKTYIGWIQKGTYWETKSNTKLYSMELWMCDQRTPLCQYTWKMKHIWKDSPDLTEKQFKQMVKDLLDNENLDLIRWITDE